MSGAAATVVSYEPHRKRLAAAATSARPSRAPGGVRPWPEQEEADAAAFRHSASRLAIPFRASRDTRATLLDDYLRALATSGWEPKTELFSMDRNMDARRKLIAVSSRRIAARDKRRPRRRSAS